MAVGNAEVFKKSAQVNNVVVPGSDVLIFGKGNAVSPGVKGVVIGDGQILEQDGMVVPNLTVTESINGAPVVGYKKYVATISQAGTADPTAIILENTIGDIVWTRLGVGQYEGLLLGAFPDADRTYTIISQANSSQGVYYITWANADSILVEWYDFAYTPADSTLLNNTIEIRVY